MGENVENVVFLWMYVTIFYFEKGFQTLTTVLEKIIEHNGGNDYNIPHIGKDKNRRRLFGPFAEDVVASPEAMRLAEEAQIDELSALLEGWDDDDYVDGVAV